MKIITSTVEKIVITEIDNLDPISIYLEDFGSGKGKLTISCYNDSWTYYWTAMGENTLSQFIISCDNHYLSKKLNPNVPYKIYDENELENYAKKHIAQLRKEDSISKKEARNLYDECQMLREYKDTDSAKYQDIMYEIFGCEWYECYPTKTNPKYDYFLRILDTVKEALIIKQSQIKK